MPSRIAISLGASFLGYATHTGFLARLHALGVRPVAVGGSSAGAIAAGLYAGGVESTCAKDLVTSWKFRLAFVNRTPWFLHYMRCTFVEANPGLFQLSGAIEALTKVLGDQQIESLREPRFMAAVCDLDQHVAHFLQQGSLAQAMVASCCVPTVFLPTQTPMGLVFDGGVAHETPIDPWLDDPDIDVIVIHRIKPSQAPKKARWMPLNLIQLTARAHACASEQLLEYRLRLAAKSGKRVLVSTTYHPRPPLFSNASMLPNYEAGEAEAERFFHAELAPLLA